MFKELVLKNRSYRGYDRSRVITKEELEELVEYARNAGSSMNVQPLKYYLAWEQEEVGEIQHLTKWAGALKDRVLPYKDKEPTAFIVVCQDTDIHPSLTAFQKDVGIVAQTILLAATEKELGGCMIVGFNKLILKEKLNLAEAIEPMLIIGLGKPDETIVLTEIEEGESIKYYRDSEDTHYVPKRKLKDIIIKHS